MANQITEAFPWDSAPEYLIRDNDGAYGEIFMRRLHAMGIRDRPTAPRSPWQNGYAERVIGSIRRECLDHLIVRNQAHLRRRGRRRARGMSARRAEIREVLRGSPFAGFRLVQCSVDAKLCSQSDEFSERRPPPFHPRSSNWDTHGQRLGLTCSCPLGSC